MPTPPRHPGPGSQEALRSANESRLMDLVRAGGAQSQADLVRASGLSAATVSVTVRRLAEDGRVTLRTATANGRRAVLVASVDPGGLSAGIDIGRTHARVLVGRSADDVLAEREVPLALGHTPDVTVPLLAALLDSLVVGVGSAAGEVTRVGVGLPGPVDEERGVVTGGAILPAWVDTPVRQLLEASFAMPVAIDNDANLGARAASVLTHAGVDDLLYVKIGTGVGAGLRHRGLPWRGHSGLAGEIGHLPLQAGGPLCRCGKRGCLETLGSTESIRQGLAAVLDREVAPEELVGLALGGSAVVRRVVADAAEALGRGLAMACTLLDPGLVVLGGPLEPLGDLLVRPLRESFDRHALMATASRTEIVMSSLGVRTEALGALLLGLDTSVKT